MERLPTYHLQSVVKAKEDDREDFSGPLDLILTLLAKNKIEIRDIKIAVILEQYLGYLEEMKQMNLEIASEFIVMASHLMQLKTKMLLTAGDEETVDELEQLMRSLEERRRLEIYEAVKSAAENLAPRSEFGRNIFTKLPEPLSKNREYMYEHEKRDLISAMAEISQRSRSALPPPLSAFEEIVEAPPFPVMHKAAEILRRLVAVGASRLSALFQGSQSRSEIVATFIAILELMSVGSLKIVVERGEEKVSYAGPVSDKLISEME